MDWLQVLTAHDQNHLSSVHLHLEQNNAILVAHWRDNSQDLDELLGSTLR